MPVRACLFDLGNVLVRFSHDRMIQNVADVTEVAESTVRRILMDVGLQWQLERGELSEEEFHREFERYSDVRANPDELRLALADIFELNAPMISLLEELSSLGTRLVLVSNTSVTHLDFIRSRWNFLELFDAVTASWQIGALKPDPRIYHSALKQANCRPSDCFYTDDIEDYVAQARALGIQAYLYTDSRTTRETLRGLGIRVKTVQDLRA